jgi:hypothetical protein
MRKLLSIGLCLFPLTVAEAHDPSHPELNGWFDKLASGKGPCCSASEGTSVADPDWESWDGHYKVKLDGVWFIVPDEAVIKGPNLIGRTWVWPIKAGRTITGIRCFIAGTMM